MAQYVRLLHVPMAHGVVKPGISGAIGRVGIAGKLCPVTGIYGGNVVMDVPVDSHAHRQGLLHVHIRQLYKNSLQSILQPLHRCNGDKMVSIESSTG